MKNLAVALVCMLMLVPSGASAATYYNYNGSIMSQQELIAHLYELIAQLQAQMDGGYEGGSSYDVEVATGEASNIDEDSASLYGSVDLNDASYARVWFDYGLTTSVNERSLTGKATSGGEYTFRADLTGLEEDATYYFRAVAEDPAGHVVRGDIERFDTDGDGSDDDDEDRPDVTTEEAEDEDEDSAELHGDVDMNDFEDGLVFFVFGQDEDLVEEIEDEYETFDDIDEDGDDLQVMDVDSSLDEDESYSEEVTNLEEDATYFFQICVEFENDDNDDEIICGGVEEFDTDDDGNDEDDDTDEMPEVTTEEAENVEEDEAELHGDVDMNDFEDGLVFFVFGQDEDLVEEIEDEYESFDDIDEDGDDLEKVEIDSGLDDESSYELHISGLDDDTDYFFQICTEFEDEDGDEMLVCGGVEEFTTEN